MDGLTDHYGAPAERAARSAQDKCGQKGQRHNRRGSKYDENRTGLPVIETVGGMGPHC